MISYALLTFIKGYQRLISPLLPSRCRFYPTCSHYGLLAIKWHGPYKGGLLTIKRISRCHPLGGHGIDFVPLPLYKDDFVPLTCLSYSAPQIRVSQIPNDPHNKYVSHETYRHLNLSRGIYQDHISYRARLNFVLNHPNNHYCD